MSTCLVLVEEHIDPSVRSIQTRAHDDVANDVVAPRVGFGDATCP